MNRMLLWDPAFRLLRMHFSALSEMSRANFRDPCPEIETDLRDRLVSPRNETDPGLEIMVGKKRSKFTEHDIATILAIPFQPDRFTAPSSIRSTNRRISGRRSARIDAIERRSHPRACGIIVYLSPLRHALSR